MPVAAQIGRVDGHGHDMAGARRDVAVAARAQVRLVRLVGLHASDLHLQSHGVELGDHHPTNAHTTRPTHTASATPTIT